MTPTTPRVRQILCPVDFSIFSAPALKHALQRAARSRARVEVIHVLSPLPYAIPGGVGIGPVAYVDPLEALASQRRCAEEDMARLVGSIPHGAELSSRLLEGDPGRVIVAEASRIAADLVVLGAHGRRAIQHLLLGSVTETVLRHSPCPVLTVGPHSVAEGVSPTFRSVVCAVDLHAESKATLEIAVNLAAESDARITLLHVVDAIEGVVADTTRPRLVKDAYAALGQLASKAGRLGFQISDRVEAGKPWRAILAVAEQERADVIVMGAHGGGLGRVAFGSTTSQVVRGASCPVLVVPDGSRPALVHEDRARVGTQAIR